MLAGRFDKTEALFTSPPGCNQHGTDHNNMTKGHFTTHVFCKTVRKIVGKNQIFTALKGVGWVKIDS